MHRLKIIAITHKRFDISEIGKFHIEEEDRKHRLSILKEKTGMDELMFLSTCNRVEFLLHTAQAVDEKFLEEFLFTAYPEISGEDLQKTISSLQVFENSAALEHLFMVASSLDSLVVGEREIISQVRNAYELCRKLELTGDFLRLVIQKTIACAKEVYTQTHIASKPVSVVSLAYRKLKELHVRPDARFLIIGAGATNSTMGKYLRKHGFTNFTVFNRTLSHAEKLASEVGGKAFPLEALKNYQEGFDVIVTCTGSSQPVITKEIFGALVSNSSAGKRKEAVPVVVDLAVPGDLDNEIPKKFNVHIIGIANLKTIAEQNLLERKKEISKCKKIIAHHVAKFEKTFKARKVELAMSDVPKKVREIREMAVKEVFAKDIQKLDEPSKEVLEKVISYLEKKYISMPMKMAKEILLEESSR